MHMHVPKQEIKSTASVSEYELSEQPHSFFKTASYDTQLQPAIDRRVVTQFMREQKQTFENFHQPQHPVQRKPNKTGLPEHLKRGIEYLSGLDLSDVRVHYNSDKPKNLQALAYAQGNDIFLGPGQEKYLPHEAWHVVQQKQGRVKPTMQFKGVEINDDTELEKEADIMGQRANDFFNVDSNQYLKSYFVSTQRMPIQRVVQFGTTKLKRRKQNVLKKIHKKTKYGIGNATSKKAIDFVIRTGKFPDPDRTEKIKIIFKMKPNLDIDEFKRQLKDQEIGMNKLTIAESLKNRENYKKIGRDPTSNAYQRKEREEAFAKKLSEFYDELGKKGKPKEEAIKEAHRLATEWIKNQAALHNPDQVAGGRPETSGMGNRRVNSSIGSQWKYLAPKLEEIIRKIARSMTPKDMKKIYMNVRLRPIKLGRY